MIKILNTFEKKAQILAFFDSIALKYDLVNTWMSMGRHHYWKKFVINQTETRLNGYILDLCCGTGFITVDLAKKVGAGGKVVGLDISPQMLAIARKNIQKAKLENTVQLVAGDAMDLPFPDNQFDEVVIGYGLRNVSDLKQVLAEIKRVLKPNGKVISLEMGKPSLPVFKQLYRVYLEYWIPWIGLILTKNRAAYQYFRDSVIAFIHQDALTKVYQEVGFQMVTCHELTWGVVAVHTGIK